MLVLACAVMIVASIVQRVTGLGFALIATPPMVLIYGPTLGVLTLVVSGLFVCFVMLIVMWRDVDWKRSILLSLAGLAAAPLAAWVSQVASPQVLLIIVGLAALLSLLGGRLVAVARVLVGTRGALIAGAASGFLHTTSGLSGPPLVAYGLNDRWEQRSFVASLQFVFVVYHLMTLAWRGLPDVDPGDMLLLVGASAVGLAVGFLLAGAIPVRWARIGMLSIAWAGTVAMLVRGVVSLLD